MALMTPGPGKFALHTPKAQATKRTHPYHTNGNSHMALGDRRSEITTARSALGCARGRHPRLGLAVRCGDLALSQKNMPFVGPIQEPRNDNFLLTAPTGEPATC